VVWLWHRDGQRWLGTESGVEVELCAGLEAESLLSLRWKGQQLVPRGGLISALLRLLFADLFVHGLGGGKYDPAVDELIRVWWGEHPPGFAVASASHYLFGEQRAELLRLREFAGRQRELQYNPDRFLGQSIFTEQAEQRLRALLAEKEVLVSELQRRRSAGMSAAEIGTQLQRLTERLRETAGADLQPQLQVLQQLSDETLQQLENRQWPWYYFLPPPPPPLP
jgi:flagellar biosynthesis chaperone FliJ